MIQALLLVREPAPDAHPYSQPPFFFLRITGLLVLMSMTISLMSVACIVIPGTLLCPSPRLSQFAFILAVWFGRQLIGYASGLSNVHELYTMSVGLYACWLLVRIGTVAAEWLPRGWNHIAVAVKTTFTVVCGFILK